MEKVTIKGLSHITGGGISENLPRVLPEGLHAVVDTSTWQQGPTFDWLASHGNIDVDEMRRTFNCGVGMMVVVAAAGEPAAAATTIMRHGVNGTNDWLPCGCRSIISKVCGKDVTLRQRAMLIAT